MKKTLHLHIGSPKTGTTSIQQTFHKNREVLNKLGFHYPGSHANHHFSFFISEAKYSDWPRQFKSYDENALAQIRNSYLESLQKELTANINQQIISSEYLFIKEKDYIKNYLSYLNKYFHRVKVYVFLRNPIDYFRSIQQQAIKARSFIASPADWSIRFKKVIEAWSQFVDVQVMEYVQGEDSCETFCRKIGISYNKLTRPAERRNTSLSLEQMLLLEKIQHYLYQQHEDNFKNHLAVVQNIDAPFTSKPDLKKGSKKAIYQNHLEDLQWLKEEYSIDFLNEELERKKTSSALTFENGKASVRDVYKVPSEEYVEKYEALVVDVLLKKLVQDN